MKGKELMKRCMAPLKIRALKKTWYQEGFDLYEPGKSYIYGSKINTDFATAQEISSLAEVPYVAVCMVLGAWNAVTGEDVPCDDKSLCKYVSYLTGLDWLTVNTVLTTALNISGIGDYYTVTEKSGDGEQEELPEEPGDI